MHYNYILFKHKSIIHRFMVYFQYIYSGTLTEKERAKMDAQVCKNRKTIYIWLSFVLALSQPFAPIIKTKVDSLTAKQIEALHNFKKGSITLYQVMVELRGGDGYSWSELVYILGLIYAILYGNPVDAAFQAPPLPHMDLPGWLSGKYDSKGTLNRQSKAVLPSRFDHETVRQIKMPWSWIMTRLII